MKDQTEEKCDGKCAPDECICPQNDEYNTHGSGGPFTAGEIIFSKSKALSDPSPNDVWEQKEKDTFIAFYMDRLDLLPSNVNKETISMLDAISDYWIKHITLARESERERIREMIEKLSEAMRYEIERGESIVSRAELFYLLSPSKEEKN